MFDGRPGVLEQSEPTLEETSGESVAVCLEPQLP